MDCAPCPSPTAHPACVCPALAPVATSPARATPCSCRQQQLHYRKVRGRRRARQTRSGSNSDARQAQAASLHCGQRSYAARSGLQLATHLRRRPPRDDRPPLPPQWPGVGLRSTPGTRGRQQRGKRRRRGRWRRCARAWRRGPRWAPLSARANPTASRPGSRRSRRLRPAGWRVACPNLPGSRGLRPGTALVPCCTTPKHSQSYGCSCFTRRQAAANAHSWTTRNQLVRAASRTGEHKLVQLCDLGFVRHAQAVQGAGAGRACKHRAARDGTACLCSGCRRSRAEDSQHSLH